MQKTKKTIGIYPSDNSIAHTAVEVLKDEFNVKTNLNDVFGCDITLLCSDNSTNYDKKVTEEIFGKKSYYPCLKTKFIKKGIRSSSSKDIEMMDNSEYVYQEFIEGDEFTVDFWWFDGKLMNYAIRKRGRVWNGISMHSTFVHRGKTQIKNILNDIIFEFNRRFYDRGLANVQFIKDKNGKYWLTEINIRPCANMCYGGDNNFILNYCRAKLGLKYKTDQIKTKEIRRYIGWKIKE